MRPSLQKGDALPSLHKGPITQLDLVKYAGASGDFNPIHTIESFARAAGLDGTIAHGMLTMAYVGQMLTNFAGVDADLTDFSVRFRSVVKPGDMITCNGTVTQIDTRSDERSDVTVQVVAENQEQVTVIKGSAIFRYEQG